MTQKREFFIHIFQWDHLRMLEVADFRNRRAAWWQTGVTKADFEEHRKKLLADDKARQAKPHQDDDDVFSLAPQSPVEEGGGLGNLDANEKAIGQDLARLRRDVSRDHRLGKGSRAPKSPKRGTAVEKRLELGKRSRRRRSLGHGRRSPSKTRCGLERR